MRLEAKELLNGAVTLTEFDANRSLRVTEAAIMKAKMALAMAVKTFEISRGGEPVEEVQNLTMRPLDLRLRLQPI